jgi:hypothetical protein
MCWFSWDATFVEISCSPNEDFRKPKNISDRRVEHFFKGVSTSFGYGYLKKCSKRRSEVFFGFRNLRLGSINCINKCTVNGRKRTKNISANS